MKSSKLNNFSAYVLTVSDKGSQNLRVDTAGPAVCDLLKEHGFNVLKNDLVADDHSQIKEKLEEQISLKTNLIVTVGGTGCAKRDITPEVTKTIIFKEIPGIAEYMRLKSCEITKQAMLSRSICGIKDDSIILNLPGSKKASTENLSFALELLPHALKLIGGIASECATNNNL